MSLQQWHANGWLKPHKTDLKELSNLLEIADRDIQDATSEGLSNDWRFGIADYVDGASESEAEELLVFARSLRAEVVTKLRQKYPTLGFPYR